MSIIQINFYIEIIGTKAYRKPTWVSQMENLQQTLKGNLFIINVQLHV